MEYGDGQHGEGRYGEQPRTYESQEFIQYIHRLWILASDRSRQIHRSVMNPRLQEGESDLQVYHDWVSVMLELWAQIQPFVESNLSEDEEFVERFNRWERYYRNPLLFEADDPLDEELNLYHDLATALHRLKITSIEAPF